MVEDKKVVEEDEEGMEDEDEEEPTIQVKTKPSKTKAGKVAEEPEEEDEEEEETEFHDPSTVYEEGSVTQKMFIDRAVERLRTLSPDLTKSLAKRLTREVIQVLADSVYSLGGDDKISLKALGTFRAVDRPERIKRNPATGEAVNVAADRTFRFKAKFHVFPELKGEEE